MTIQRWNCLWLVEKWYDQLNEGADDEAERRNSNHDMYGHDDDRSPVLVIRSFPKGTVDNRYSNRHGDQEQVPRRLYCIHGF